MRLLPAPGVTPYSFDLRMDPFSVEAAEPIGYHLDPPKLPLMEKPTRVAGFPVDYPFGLPASVLATNAKWINFYVKRGFCVLTYKTVRSEARDPHPWPNWVFVEDLGDLTPPFEEKSVVGYPGYWPRPGTRLSMANSYGIPSREPAWWKEDVKQARGFVQEGHQVLIVSVTASTKVGASDQMLVDDFVNVALQAKAAGAQIIEANIACPNTREDRAGDVYQDPALSGHVCKALYDALQGTPLFIKIGYLPEAGLRGLLDTTRKYIRGVVAINTISVAVLDNEGNQCFPGTGRRPAGISGAAIKKRAQEVVRNLVRIREDSQGDRFDILAVGGVLGRQDADEYLDAIKADVVESATGAFLNPNLGLEVRLDQEKLSVTDARRLMAGEAMPVGEKAYVAAYKIVSDPALHMALTLIGRGQIADFGSIEALANSVLQDASQSPLKRSKIQKALRNLAKSGYVRTKGSLYTLTPSGEELAEVIAGTTSPSP